MGVDSTALDGLRGLACIHIMVYHYIRYPHHIRRHLF